VTPYEPFESFLLGEPDATSLSTVIQPDSHAYSSHYATFVQDDWKVSSRLTVNFGMRYEYHPMMLDHLNNTTNFLPNYVSVVNGVTVRGAVVIPNQAAFSILNPAFAASIGRNIAEAGVVNDDVEMPKRIKRYLHGGLSGAFICHVKRNSADTITKFIYQVIQSSRVPRCGD
jgi:hypothetical protein